MLFAITRLNVLEAARGDGAEKRFWMDSFLARVEEGSLDMDADNFRSVLRISSM